MLALFLVLVSFVPVATGILYSYVSKDLPSVELLNIALNVRNGTLLLPTTIYDRSEKTILYQLQNEGIFRRFLMIDPNNQEFLSPYLVQFTVAAYEEDFWTSSGFTNNWLEDIGPTTIAEQLVDRLLLWQEPDSKIRNIRMKLLAAQITKKYGRTQVLEWFLNSQSYGHFTIGADTAARLYFSKPASQLTMAESALLVSVSKTPSLNPIDAPQAAMENQKILLKQLFDEKKISDIEYKDAIAEDVVIQEVKPESQSIANAFSNLVLSQLFELFSYERIELGGIDVVTTLDTNFQSALTCTMNAQMEILDKKPPTEPFCEPAKFLSSNINDFPETADISTSAIILDPKSGEVLALIGDRDGSIESGQIPTHQAGSILTPLIGVNAFARGFTLGSQVWDIPTNLSSELIEYVQPDNSYQGPMRLRNALANNYLTPIGAILEQLGPDIVWKSAKSFGLATLSNESSATLLYEGKSANILEVAQFYATFANLGIRIGKINERSQSIEPILIKNVITTDQVLLYEMAETDSQSILSNQLAYLIHDFLQDDSARSLSLGYPNQLEIGRPAGAKFGHTYNNEEVWAAGYTPQYTTVVWYGNNAIGKKAVDYKISGNVWYAMMQWLHKDLAIETWSTPPGISEKEVCAVSGLLPTNECPELAKEKFIDGTQPVNTDNLFKSFEINRETGLLATVFTPVDLIEKKIFMIIPDSALEWAKLNGIEIPPRDYDSIQSPETNTKVRITTPKIYEFVHGPIEIRGTVSGGNLRSIRIQIGSGLNPQSWFQIGEEQTETLVNGDLATWETENYEDGLYALRLQVIREDQTIETHTIQVTVDNTPPLVNVLFPKMNDEIELSTNGVTTIQAEIRDETAIAKVEWWVDGVLFGTTNKEPFSFPTTLNGGKHTIQIKAFDLAGNSSSSELIEFILK
ncbi:MAG: penicillin-binding protein [Anaerolineaceae bacterium]|nr:penicillin-binding protein [Anaerolineaceae bacterium]